MSTINSTNSMQDNIKENNNKNESLLHKRYRQPKNAKNPPSPIISQQDILAEDKKNNKGLFPSVNDTPTVFFDYFCNLQYLGGSYFFQQWLDRDNKNRAEKEKEQGWKTHVLILSKKDYMYMMKHVLPFLRKRKIEHKIVRFHRLEEFNEDYLQKGKILTIYDADLNCFKNAPQRVKKFLLEEQDYHIKTDKHIGGRVFVRYTCFNSDRIYNPNTNKYEFMPREENIYKPSWMDEPPTLMDLF